MKLKILSLVGVIALVGGIAALLNSCGGGDKTDMSMHELIGTYFVKDMSLADKDARWSAYFDFSDGMQHAYAEQDTKSVLHAIVQKISGSSDRFNVFSLGDDSIATLPAATIDLYNKIIDANSYKRQQAPIEKTLAKIVADSVSAILVTDFEEYTADGSGAKRVQHAPFATPYFKEWLQRGGDITFFVTPYKEQGKDKRLYYIVFDNARHELLSFFEDGLKSAPQNFTRFQLSTHPFDVTTHYLAASKGGTFHDAKGEDFVTMSREEGDDDSFIAWPEMKMEYYNFEGTWKDIVENAEGQSDPEIPAKERFKHLLGDVTIDLSNEDSYHVTALGVRALDVTADFDQFSKCLEAINHKPTAEELADEDFEGNDYFDGKGVLKPEYQYQPQPVTEILDMLVFDTDGFNQSVATDRKAAAMAVNLDPKFNGSFNGKAPRLLRVDIVIAEAQPADPTRLNDLFAWGINENLASAIRNVLQELNPVGAPVYTYFISTVEE